MDLRKEDKFTMSDHHMHTVQKLVRKQFPVIARCMLPKCKVKFNIMLCMYDLKLLFHELGLNTKCVEH